jgi:hypothetical protein
MLSGWEEERERVEREGIREEKRREGERRGGRKEGRRKVGRKKRKEGGREVMMGNDEREGEKEGK